MVQVLVNGRTILRWPGTFKFGFQALLLLTLVIPVCSEKYSDFLLNEETGKYIFKTSAGLERLCHICPEDLSECGGQPRNRDCEAQNPLPWTETDVPWCNCGLLVGCDHLPVFDNGTYRCWPFGQWKGTTYQTCVPECIPGFRLTQGNIALRCGESRTWNETVVTPICVQIKQEPGVNKEVSTVGLGVSTKSSSPSVTGSDQRPDNKTIQDVEPPSQLNPVVIGPLAGACFLILVSFVVFLCWNYNKRCRRCPQRKSAEQAITVDLPKISADPVSPAAPITEDPSESTADEAPSAVVTVHSSSQGEVESIAGSSVVVVDTSADEESVPLLAEETIVKPEDSCTESAQNLETEEMEKTKQSTFNVTTGHGEAKFPSSSLPTLSSGRTITIPSNWNSNGSTAQTESAQNLKTEEKEKVKESPLSVMTGHGEAKLPLSSLPSLNSGRPITIPSNWNSTGSTTQTDRDLSDGKLLPPDGPTLHAASSIQLDSDSDPDPIPVSAGTETAEPLTDLDLCLPLAPPLTLTTPLFSRHEPDGADSLDVDEPAQQTLFDRQKKHHEDQDSEAVKTNVVGFVSSVIPGLVRNQATPDQTHVYQREAKDHQTHGYQREAEDHRTHGYQREAEDHQTHGYQREAEDHRTHGYQSEAEDHQTPVHHHSDASADQARTDVIGTDECVTFSDFQEERDASIFFSKLDTILIGDNHEEKNWFGVSKWILTPYKIDLLVEYLEGLKKTVHDPPGSAYFIHVINNHFVRRGVKLGQVLYFYAEIHPHYKIKQLFQKYHPECGYCQQFYDVKKK